MTNPESVNDKTELEKLAEQEQALKVALDRIQVQKREVREKQIEEERRKKIAQENAPMVVKVVEVNVDEDQLYISKAIIENNPIVYHRHFVDFLRNVQGRIYLSVDVGTSNRNMIPCSELEYVVERLKNMEGITVDWDFQAWQRFKEWKHLKEAWESRPDYWVDYDEQSQQFTITQGQGGIYTIDYIYGTRKHVTKKETTWSLALVEGYRLEDSLSRFKVEFTTAAQTALEEELKKKEAQKGIADKKTSDIEVGFINGHELLPFQKVGVEFAVNANGNAIIADGTGLGKTWQGIGVCEYLKRPAIVICPASVKENWRREIKRLTGHDAYVCKSTMPSEWDVEVMHKRTHKYIIMNYDIFGKAREIQEEGKEKITRYFWADVIRELGTYNQIIFDEAHRIKNTSANRTKATLHLGDKMNYLFLTATPVLNRPRELYSPLRLIRPGQYLSEQHFLENYMWTDGRVRNVEHLRETLATILIRRKREEVQTDLPPIQRIYDWYELSPEAMVRYQLALEGLYKRLEEFSPDDTRDLFIEGILAQITRLKQIVAQDKVDRIAELATELVDSEEGEGQGKVVIFSGFKPVVRAIARRLGHEAVCFDGDIKPDDRQPIVDQFQNDPQIKFLVATGQTAGEGLTMTAGGFVIFSDFGWTPAYHQQCEGRIYGRLNEAHGAISYYIVGINTIEEWIQELLAKKLQIIEQIVEGNDDVDAGKNMGYELIKRMKREQRQAKGK